jgi:hypothetical protein
MAKSISESMDDLYQDVVRWRAELVRLRAEGHTSTVEQVEKLITDAERVLSRWEKPN